MSDASAVDYGPLTSLIGVWSGDKGLDIAPEPDGAEHNPYFETITYAAIGDVTNAESQVLSALHYHQLVSRKSDGEVFHNETGYWMWDPKSEVVMHSLTIPRGVCLLAGGKYTGNGNSGGGVTIDVTADAGEGPWRIIQSPFMQENARTTSFRQRITVEDGKMSYAETTMVDIYGKTFEHTDENELVRE